MYNPSGCFQEKAAAFFAAVAENNNAGKLLLI